MLYDAVVLGEAVTRRFVSQTPQSIKIRRERLNPLGGDESPQ